MSSQVWVPPKSRGPGIPSSLFTLPEIPGLPKQSPAKHAVASPSRKPPAASSATTVAKTPVLAKEASARLPGKAPAVHRFPHGFPLLLKDRRLLDAVVRLRASTFETLAWDAEAMAASLAASNRAALNRSSTVGQRWLSGRSGLLPGVSSSMLLAGGSTASLLAPSVAALGNASAPSVANSEPERVEMAPSQAAPLFRTTEAQFFDRVRVVGENTRELLAALVRELLVEIEISGGERAKGKTHPSDSHAKTKNQHALHRRDLADFLLFCSIMLRDLCVGSAWEWGGLRGAIAGVPCTIKLSEDSLVTLCPVDPPTETLQSLEHLRLALLKTAAKVYSPARDAFLVDAVAGRAAGTVRNAIARDPAAGATLFIMHRVPGQADLDALATAAGHASSDFEQRRTDERRPLSPATRERVKAGVAQAGKDRDHAGRLAEGWLGPAGPGVAALDAVRALQSASVKAAARARSASAASRTTDIPKSISVASLATSSVAVTVVSQRPGRSAAEPVELTDLANTLALAAEAGHEIVRARVALDAAPRVFRAGIWGVCAAFGGSTLSLPHALTRELGQGLAETTKRAWETTAMIMARPAQHTPKDPANIGRRSVLAEAWALVATRAADARECDASATLVAPALRKAEIVFSDRWEPEACREIRALVQALERGKWSLKDALLAATNALEAERRIDTNREMWLAETFARWRPLEEPLPEALQSDPRAATVGTLAGQILAAERDEWTPLAWTNAAEVAAGAARLLDQLDAARAWLLSHGHFLVRKSPIMSSLDEIDELDLRLMDSATVEGSGVRDCPADPLAALQDRLERWLRDAHHAALHSPIVDAAGSPAESIHPTALPGLLAQFCARWDAVPLTRIDWAQLRAAMDRMLLLGGRDPTGSSTTSAAALNRSELSQIDAFMRAAYVPLSARTPADRAALVLAVAKIHGIDPEDVALGHMHTAPPEWWESLPVKLSPWEPGMDLAARLVMFYRNHGRPPRRKQTLSAPAARARGDSHIVLDVAVSARADKTNNYNSNSNDAAKPATGLALAELPAALAEHVLAGFSQVSVDGLSHGAMRGAAEELVAMISACEEPRILPREHKLTVRLTGIDLAGDLKWRAAVGSTALKMRAELPWPRPHLGPILEELSRLPL